MSNIFEARPPQAADGSPGDFYYDITDLDLQIVDHYGPKAVDGTWPLIGRMDQLQITRNTLPADPKTGSEGDLHHVASSSEVYGPKTSGAWPGPVRVRLPSSIQEDGEQRAREFFERERRLPPAWRR